MHYIAEPLYKKYNIFNRFHVTLLSSGLNCATEEPLLQDAITVPDSYFTASSEYGASFAARNARVGASSYWCPDAADIGASPPTLFLGVSPITI